MSKSRKLFLKLCRFALLACASISLIALTAWEFWENQMAKPVDEQSVAVNYFIAGSKRDTIQLLLARQLGLTAQPPLSQTDAKREFWQAHQELQVTWMEESKHSSTLGQYILGPKFKIKLILAYVVAAAVTMETIRKVFAAWRALHERD